MKNIGQITYICLFLLVLCSGCARPGYWHIIGRETAPFTNEKKGQFRSDLYQCQKDAEFVSYGKKDWLYPGQSRDQWFNKCMRLKGYEWIKGTPPGDSYDPLR